MEAFVVQQEEVDLPRGAWTGTHRVGVHWRGRRLFSISQGPFRSYLFPVFTPKGFAVTSESPADHPHHNSIWVASDRVRCRFPYRESETEEGTYNFYINNTFQGRAAGQIRGTALEHEEISTEHLRITQSLVWQGPQEWAASEGRILIKEKRTLDIRPGERVNLIDIRSSLSATEWPLELGPTRHAFFGVRMTEALTSMHGAVLRDPERQGTASVNGRISDWLDYSGTLGSDVRAGVALFPHPSAAGHPWHATDWGVLNVNPLDGRAYSLTPGENLAFALRIVVHDGDADEAGIFELYQEFIDAAGRGPT